MILSCYKFEISRDFADFGGNNSVRRMSATALKSTDFTDLNLYYIKGALALFVLVSFSDYVC